MRRFTAFLLVAVLLSTLSVSASASGPDLFRRVFSTLTANPTFTAAWSGIWSVDTVERDCDTGTITNSTSEQDTICTGSSIGPEDEGFPVTCDGTITDTSLSDTCTGSFEIIPDCTADFSYSVSGTRNGDSLTGTSTVSFTYTGTGCGGFFPDQCHTQEITGTRMAPQPGACNTPVLPTSWGVLKSRYVR